MPANLPPQYSKAEDEFRAASTPAERLEKVREMFRLLPKHKGTEKLQAELKQKISRFRDEVEGAASGAKKRSTVSHRVQSDGAGQVVLVGAPNVGKSSLLAASTKAEPKIAAYPFTTREPQPGMANWLDVSYQLVDLPPISADVMEPWLPSIVSASDAALLVVDLSEDDCVDAAEAVIRRLAEAHVELVSVIPAGNDDERTHFIKAAVVANKSDLPDAIERYALVSEWFSERFPVVSVSAAARRGLDELTRTAYDLLGVIRVYTKTPGKPLEKVKPFTLESGSTVADLARSVHQQLEQSLKFARIWGSGVFEGQSVKRDHVLSDADVVELHA